MSQDPNTEIGSRLILFVDPQAASSFGTIATDSPVAADAVRALDASFNGKSPFKMKDDMRGTSTKAGKIDQKRTAEWSADIVAYISGAAGTAPDWADLVLNQMQAITGTGSVIEGATSTTTVLAITSAAGLAVNGCVMVNGEIRRVTVIDVSATPDTITVTPALSDVPTAGDAVTAGITYQPDDDAANTQAALTLWAFNNRTAERMIGGIAKTWSLSMGGSDEARMTFGGPARRADRLVAVRLTAGIDNAVTTIPVDDGRCVPSDVSVASPVYLMLDLEVLKVTGVTANDLTVAARGAYLTGGAAASHLDDAILYPYQPTPTLTDSPIASTAGDIIVDGVELQMTDFSVEYDSGIVVREGEHGDKYNLAGYAPAQGTSGGGRAVSFTANGFLYADTTQHRLLEAHAREAVQVFCQQGDTAGAALAVEFPGVRMEEPDIQRGSEQITVSLAGMAESATAEAEFFLMVV